jgi:hypothetical protein
MTLVSRILCALGLSAAIASSQSVQLRPAARLVYPTRIDGNCPSFWNEAGLNLFSSVGTPEMISSAPEFAGPWVSEEVEVTHHQHFPLWIESAWVDVDGTVFGWYHHEPDGVCEGDSLTSPKIGAVVSYDGGKTIKDLGIVLESGDPVDCAAKNGFFAGGHGDFSVIPDREGKYFYFFFTNYAGDVSTQGIVVARLDVEDRYKPAGRVFKYYQGEWTEPGIGGRVTPVFPARQSWSRSDTDSFWGPALSWNTHLRQYVMLLNRSCCRTGWPQEGIYASFSNDLTNPASWKVPSRILSGKEAGAYYPQTVGLGAGETDSVSGEVGRLFIQGVSEWEMIFSFGGSAPEGGIRDDRPPVDPRQGKQ